MNIVDTFREHFGTLSNICNDYSLVECDDGIGKSAADSFGRNRHFYIIIIGAILIVKGVYVTTRAVEEQNGHLIIEDTTKGKVQLFGSNTFKDAVLTLYIPTGTVFDHINLTTGAGRLTIDILSAATLDFELGAGEVIIGSLIATKSADIEGGAGQITVSDGAIKNLDLEMGVGQLNLTTALTGECRLESGVGETNITLIGNKDDYKLELKKGLGSISVDGKDVSYYGSGGNGTNKVEIHGGVGAINVNFKESQAK